MHYRPWVYSWQRVLTIIRAHNALASFPARHFSTSRKHGRWLSRRSRLFGIEMPEAKSELSPRENGVALWRVPTLDACGVGRSNVYRRRPDPRCSACLSRKRGAPRISQADHSHNGGYPFPVCGTPINRRPAVNWVSRMSGSNSARPELSVPGFYFRQLCAGDRSSTGARVRRRSALPHRIMQRSAIGGTR
jgi:hypothetical protein